MPVPLTSINRYALVLEPAEAYLAWAKEYPDPAPDLTLERLRSEGGSIYLIPDTHDNPEGWLMRNYKPLFEEELYAWCLAEHLWPPKRDYMTFREFFEVRFHSIVLDTVGGPLVREDG
jgi:hypothetical protein